MTKIFTDQYFLPTFFSYRPKFLPTNKFYRLIFLPTNIFYLKYLINALIFQKTLLQSLNREKKCIVPQILIELYICYITIYKIYVLSEFILKKYFLYLKDFDLLALLHSHLFTFVSYFCKGANIITIYNENSNIITDKCEFLQ